MVLSFSRGLAADLPKKHFDLPAADATETLRLFTEQSGEHIVYLIDHVRGERTNAVRGTMTAAESLQRMLAGTNLAMVRRDGAFAISRKPPATNSSSDPRSQGGDQTLSSTPRATSSPGEPGTIRGRVSSASSSEYLAGAAVSIDSLNLRTITDADGSFILFKVPSGTQRVKVLYTGQEPFFATVEVPAGGSVSVDAQLGSGVLQMGTFTVRSEREGNALAITQQRMADNVKNVVATDAFGNSANGNAADLLQRLPGIVVDYVAADPREIRIRGVSPELSTVTMDGTDMANASSGTARTFNFQFMSNMSMLESIEVNKALTPEMDAASVGGSINLRSKSPLQSRITQQTTYQVSANFDRGSKNAHRFQPSFSGTFMKVWGEKRKVGLMLNAGYDSYFHAQDNTSITFQPAETSPTYLTAFNAIDGPKFTYRSSGGFRLDFELSPTWTAFVSTSVAWYQAHLNSRTFNLTAAGGVAQIVNGQFTGNGTILPDYTEYVTAARAHATNTSTNLSQTNNWVTSGSYLVQPGARHKYDTLEIDYHGSFSSAQHKVDRNGDRGVVSARLRNVGWIVDRTRNQNYPEWRFTSGPDAWDLDNYDNLTVTYGQSLTNDENYGGQFNVRKIFPGRFPLEFKTGGRFVDRTRSLSGTPYTYTFLGSDGVNGLNSATGINDDRISRFQERDYYRNPTVGNYRSPNWVSAREVAKHFAVAPQEFLRATYNNVRDGLRGEREAREAVYAGYVQGRIAVGKFSLLTGVRTERTDVRGEGSLQLPLLTTVVDPVTGQSRRETVEEAIVRIRDETTAQRTARLAAETARRNADPVGAALEEWGTRNKVKGSYQNYFPSVHLRYAVTPNVILRASYATGIGRPNFTNLMPNESVNYDTEVVTASNPSLKPQFVDNYDLSAEYYFEPVGSLSVGWFRKDIKDFIFSSGGTIIGPGTDNGFNGLYEGFSLTTSRNGGEAKIDGFEISYQQQYTFLPGWLKGLGGYANYTKIKTEGDYGSGEARATSTVPGFVPETINAGVSYAYMRFSVRLKWNYKERQLVTYNANPASLVYNSTGSRYDVNLRVKLSPRLDLFADVINVTGTPIKREVGTLARINAYQNNGKRALVGISGRF